MNGNRGQLMNPVQAAQALAVLFALLAAGAWVKSAADQAGFKPGSGRIDNLLNRISTKPSVWNAIAAGLSAVAAICQAIAYLLIYP